MGAKRLSYFFEGTARENLRVLKNGDNENPSGKPEVKLDYSPFGMQLPGRNGSVSDYRYGFNGMMKDDEIKGDGNSYTTEFRQYDPRIGRWFSIDPIVHPYQSPYCAFDNSPIIIMDPLGADGDPANRALNQNINSGKGDKTKAGQVGVDADGRRFIYADVSVDAPVERSNAYRIWLNYVARPGDVNLSSTEEMTNSKAEFYSWNPGLEENKTTIGQGQIIYIDPPTTTDAVTEECSDEQSQVLEEPSLLDQWIDAYWAWERQNGADVSDGETSEGEGGPGGKLGDGDFYPTGENIPTTTITYNTQSHPVLIKSTTVTLDDGRVVVMNCYSYHAIGVDTVYRWEINTVDGDTITPIDTTATYQEAFTIRKGWKYKPYTPSQQIFK